MVMFLRGYFFVLIEIGERGKELDHLESGERKGESLRRVRGRRS
jgi:hypothetical protein